MKLSDLRKEAGLTQAGLAEKLTAAGHQANQSLVSQWENEVIALSPEWAVRIEAVLGAHRACERLLPDVEWKRAKSGHVLGYLVPVGKVA